MTVPLSAQATAVELAAVNLRGHCETLAQQVRKGKRPQSDLDMASMSLPALQAAAVTMRWLAQHELQLREFVGTRGKPADALLAGEGAP